MTCILAHYRRDGTGQNNPIPSEGLWGGGPPNLRGGASTGGPPDTERANHHYPGMHEGRTQIERLATHAGSRLKLPNAWEGPV